MGSTPSGIDQSTIQTTSSAPPQYVEFYWREGGVSVFFCGSFNYWRERIPMYYTQPGVWVGTRELVPGIYQFKYVVDGQWRCSSDYECVKDYNGNQNNQIQVKIQQQPLVPKNAESDPQRRQMQQIEYMFSTVVPEQPFTVWTTFPPELPRQLVKTPLNANVLNEAYQPTNLLPIPDHVVLTHFFKQKKRKNFCITASTARYRSKYVTVVLYVSNEPESYNHVPKLANVYFELLDDIKRRRAYAHVAY